MSNWYEEEARKLISRIEEESLRKDEDLVEFYRGLKQIIEELNERMAAADDELSPEERKRL